MRWFILFYGCFSYGLFVLTLFYSVAFMGNLQWSFPSIAPLIPISVDQARPASSVLVGLVFNLALLFLFALQHSGMARLGFKRWLKKFVPDVIERSTYVLFSSLALIILILGWHTLPIVIWDLRGSIVGDMLQIGFYLGWLLVMFGTSVIGKHDPFGIKRVIYHFRGEKFVPPGFAKPFWYNIVRHPIYLAFFMAFWITPYMSLGHLLFAIMVAFYLLMAISLEEKDLVTMYGDSYRNYQKEVPGKLFPSFGSVFWKKR